VHTQQKLLITAHSNQILHGPDRRHCQARSRRHNSHARSLLRRVGSIWLADITRRQGGWCWVGCNKAGGAHRSSARRPALAGEVGGAVTVGEAPPPEPAEPPPSGEVVSAATGFSTSKVAPGMAARCRMPPPPVRPPPPPPAAPCGPPKLRRRGSTHAAPHIISVASQHPVGADGDDGLDGSQPASQPARRAGRLACWHAQVTRLGG
jgi:hypothetical protein